MALKPGTRLGPYEILAQLGAGGMGEVYKGRDVRLERLVALKVLAPHLAANREARERFEREATTVAKLKHAHICLLYDIGKDGDRDYLVFEYLEGETLSQRLAKGPLPLDQVLQYAIEISDALDKAHRAGVTHRDIKPGNIMIVPSSETASKTETKLLDFGLAKLKQAALPANLADLPRNEWPTGAGAPTEEGRILGTMQYMAPEQVEGKVNELDARTDIFSFGATVYEMATGKKAFQGQSQASIMASILKEDPPPVSTFDPPGKLSSPALDRVVKTCLAKDPDERWQTARDLWRELKWIREGGADGRSLTVAAQIDRPKLRQRVAWGITAVAVLLFGVLAVLHFRESPLEQRVTRLTLLPPENATLPVDAPIISPDGQRLAFAARDASGRTLLWLRPLDSLEAQPLAGTESASDPFWSPDSRFLGFFADGKLKKIEVSGGPPQTLADTGLAAVFQGAWNRDGTIVFSTGTTSELAKVPAAGGTITPATTLDPSRREVSHRYPQFLPDGRRFLYLSFGAEPGIYVGSLDGEEPRRILNVSSNASYAHPGYLIFAREGTLMAQPFDAGRVELTGDAFPIAEDVQFTPVAGFVDSSFSVSENGVLAYRIGGGASATQFAWLDRTGKDLERFGETIGNAHFTVSPGEGSLAVERITPEGRDLWLRDMARGTTSRFALGLFFSAMVWSPDGNWLTFSASRGESSGIYQKLSSGAGQEELLLNASDAYPTDRSRDGNYLLYFRTDPKSKGDLWVLPLSGERQPKSFLESDFNEGNGQFSPDGRWVAYVSDESGRLEVYVQPFPGPGAKWQISTDGGIMPKWRADGKELFYFNQGKVVAVDVNAGEQFTAGVPRMLFEVPLNYQGIHNGDHYAVSDDGQRFLFVLPREEAGPAYITVVQNWPAGIRK